MYTFCQKLNDGGCLEEKSLTEQGLNYPLKKKNIFSLGLLFLYLIKYKTGLATQIFVLIKNVHSNKK